jgi:hypothetical protein
MATTTTTTTTTTNAACSFKGVCWTQLCKER